LYEEQGRGIEDWRKDVVEEEEKKEREEGKSREIGVRGRE